MFNVTLRNKKTLEILTTDEHGVVAMVAINADGTYELQEVGSITNDFNSMSSETFEKYYEPDDFDLIECHYELPSNERAFLLSKEEIIKDVEPLLNDAFNIHHFDEILIGYINGFYVSEFTEEEEKALHDALSEIEVVKFIYPRGHFLSDQQNWKVSFLPNKKDDNFKTKASMNVDELHEGVEEYVNKSKVSSSSPYGKFLHNNKIDGLGKYVICADVIFDNGMLLEIDLIDKRGKSKLVSHKLLENNDVTIINHKYVPMKIQHSLIYKFRQRAYVDLSFAPHGRKVKTVSGQTGLVIGAVDGECSVWGKYYVAVIDEGEIIFYCNGDICNGILTYIDDTKVKNTYDTIRVGNEMASIMFNSENCKYVQSTI